MSKIHFGRVFIFSFSFFSSKPTIFLLSPLPANPMAQFWISLWKFALEHSLFLTTYDVNLIYIQFLCMIKPANKPE